MYYGPYKVLQNIGMMAYKWEFLASSRSTPNFPVSCLKKVISDKIPVQRVFPKIFKEGKIIFEPELAMEIRI